VKITWLNGAPTARAGADQTSAGGQVVTLNGSASSDPDGSPLTYRWTQTSGPAVKLRNTASVQTTFTAPEVTKSQSLVFKLTVKDPQGLKGTDTVVVNIMPANMAPIANAGPDQNVEEGEVVTLNGSNSIDPDGIIISYEWKQTSGNMVNLSSCTAAQPTFVAPYTNPEGEALTFELTVIDSQGLKSTDSCIINIIWVNDPPVADAGDDQNVEEGQMVTLCGMDSIDPDGAIAAWQWKQISGISVALSSYTIAEPTFTAPRVNQDGNTLVFELTVTDSHGLKSSDTCVVNVLWVNDPPVANAGSDQDTVSGKKVALNGSASVDYDGFISSYLWTQVSGTPVTLSNPTAVKPTFTPGISSLGETLVFQLTVTDNGGLKSTSDCAVTVSKSVRAVTSSWNLVTIPKTTVKTTVNNALTPIMSNVISIWAYENNSWKVFDPSKPETSSTLNGLAPGRAVWVNMSQDAELAISAAVTVDPVILVPGWNLVGYNSSTSKNISGAISSISKNIKGIWTYADGKWKIFDPKNPGLSDLQVLEPGSGYWVYVDKRCSWTY
ncbi:MAG: hypothetical protein GX846_09720, partial [Deltaproteobacteria bacterium]|nr:hypothetical protein [Deltaproteobacteria bacterium]